MRRLHREALSEEATDLLCRRTAQIIEAGHEGKTIKARAQARRDKAKRLWKKEGTKAFDEIAQTLRRMAPSNERCMYCEDSEGTDIEHFWPKAKYPARAYAWDNYLWACSACNSNHKRNRFPTDTRGRPLLINPMEEDPLDHLVFSPMTGKYIAIDDKGEQSIDVFGLDRYPLVTSRREAWGKIEGLILQYASASRHEHLAWKALDAQRSLCRHPHVSAFAALLRIAESSQADAYILPECREALAAHPEIKDWLV